MSENNNQKQEKGKIVFYGGFHGAPLAQINRLYCILFYSPDRQETSLIKTLDKGKGNRNNNITVEVFYPAFYVTPVNPRSCKIRPYFPNYLFVHVDLKVVNVSDLRWMPGALGLVSFDGDPASVPDTLIAAVKKHVETYNVTVRDQKKGFQSGDSGIIEDGPFAGYEPVFGTHISGQDRVRVLLSLLQRRQLPIEISSSQIRRVKHR